MFRHQMCHPQGTRLHYLAKLNKYNCSYSCNCTYLIWQGNEGKFPEDDTFGVETCMSLIIYIFIIIVLLLVDLQIIKNARYMHENDKIVKKLFMD